MSIYLWGIDMTEKTEVLDEICIKINNKEFVGQRTIEGTRNLYQTISYRGLSRPDGHPYKPSERATMDSVAKIILREFVQEAGDYPA
jgi:hypothetical protein